MAKKQIAVNVLSRSGVEAHRVVEVDNRENGMITATVKANGQWFVLEMNPIMASRLHSFLVEAVTKQIKECRQILRDPQEGGA